MSANMGLDKLFKCCKSFRRQSSNIEQVCGEKSKQDKTLGGLACSPLSESLVKCDREIKSKVSSTEDVCCPQKPPKRSNASSSSEVLSQCDGIRTEKMENRENVTLQLCSCSQNDCTVECENHTFPDPDKLTEMISKSIKAAVQNLANVKQQENQKPAEPLAKNKEVVTSSTQYSDQAMPFVRPVNGSGSVYRPCGDNGGLRNLKRSCNYQQRSTQQKFPETYPWDCEPFSEPSTVSSVICKGEKDVAWPQIVQAADNQSVKPRRAKKTSKPRKPSKHLNTDNRKMTGNVNIYICSEGNEVSGQKKKSSESSPDNSTVVTNTSYAYSSSDESSKTIQDLIPEKKNPKDLSLKRAFSEEELPPDCECLQAPSNSDDSDVFCLCSISSLNPSNETHPEYTAQSWAENNNRDSEHEFRYTRRKFDTDNGSPSIDKNPTGNGDASFSSYCEDKYSGCKVSSECYAPQSSRENDGCTCCESKRDSLNFGSRQSDVCCKNNCQPLKRDHSIKASDSIRGSICGGKKQHPSRCSNFCIVEEDEERVDSVCGRESSKREMDKCGQDPTVRSVATKISVVEVVKSLSNATDVETCCNVGSAVSCAKPSVEPIECPKKEVTRESRLRWSLNKAKSLLRRRCTSAESKKSKSPVCDSKRDLATENDELLAMTTKNGTLSTLRECNGNEELQCNVFKDCAVDCTNSLVLIKSSTVDQNKSKGSADRNNRTQLSDSKIDSIIMEAKNSLQSHCNKNQDDCECENRKLGIREGIQLCNCTSSKDEQKLYPPSPEDVGFRVCTLCCQAENDCRCNSEKENCRQSKLPSNISYSGARKSQICVYCDERQENCVCRPAMEKCSYCRMPADVCNCQRVCTETCDDSSYGKNACQCVNRVIHNPDGGDQSISVTAWKPNRDIRKYFSKNPRERGRPDCSCCDNIRPYGSDNLPYQRLSVFSDVMTELQQKMKDLPGCNRCEKIPCGCYIQGINNHSSSAPEDKRPYKSKHRKSRSRSPLCRDCLGIGRCKCGGRKTPLLKICDRCRTTPCRCRRSRSTQRKPQAKCYYCKSSPCRCELSKSKVPKIYKCSESPARFLSKTAAQASERSPGRISRSCRCCSCGNPSCGSAPPGKIQERRSG